MCGIAGVYAPRGDGSRASVTRMIGAITYRGPDDFGIESLDDNRVVLGHRRLSILDLSPLGHQPMPYADGSLWIAFNGEIYNFKSLRDELVRLGHSFRSESDTEVVLASYQEWGDEAFCRFHGMFALAIWDRAKCRFLLVRDRFGVKPLYYASHGGRIWFGSELRAILAGESMSRQVDSDALAEYLRFGYVSAPRSMLSGIHTVMPGELLEFDKALNKRAISFWNTTSELNEGPDSDLARELSGLGDEALLDRAESIFTDAFALRLVADVPVGLFLSGGIDSSLVATLLAIKRGVTLRTFTIGYSDSEFDESRYARFVANRLGATHTERIIEPDDALQLCDRIVDVFDEPMADSSCLPTLMVCQLARESVKVTLSADGADELFGGYARYGVVNNYLQHRQGGTGALFGFGARALTALPTSWLAAAYRLRTGSGPRYAAIEDKLRKFRAMARAPSDRDAYLAAVSEWGAIGSSDLMRVARQFDDASATWDAARMPDPRARMMHFDALRYLTGDLLTKVDRTSMSVSLEAREPFLDQQIVRLAAALPMHWKIRGREGKYLLRRLLARHFPPEFFARPKQGFSAPIAKWLRGAMRERLTDRLSVGSVQRVGLLNAPVVQEMTTDFLAERGDASAAGIWTLYQLQCWADRWLATGT